MKLNILLTIFAISMLAPQTKAQNSQYSLYGYFFYTIAKYVEWPDQFKSGDFTIGVVGPSEATQHLKTLAMKKDVNGRPIKIIEFSSIESIKPCNMLLVPAKLSSDFQKVAGKVEGFPVLLVTEKEGMALKGSCINFVTKDNKLAFEMNRAAFNKAGLKASSELSKFAIML